MKTPQINSEVPFVYKPTRRRFLHTMGLAAAAPFLSSFLPEGFAAVNEAGNIPPHELRFTTRDGRDPGHKVVVVFMQGGLSWEDTFNPKPSSPFRQIDTVCDDIKLTELLAPLAEHMNNAVVINNLHGGNGYHDFGAALGITGSGAVRNNDFYAEALNPNPFVEFSRMLTNESSEHVGYVILHQSSSDTNGFDRSWTRPWDALKSNDPETIYSAIDTRTGAFTDPLVNSGEIDRNRFNQRMRLLEVLDAHGHTLTGRSVERRTRALRAASNIIGNFNTTFNLRSEGPEVLARYGNTNVGRQFLLARRMLQSGARVIVVNDGNHDLHYALREDMPGKIRPVAQGLSALLNDTKQMMRREKVYVVLVSEFGRAPRFNEGGLVRRGNRRDVFVTPGREHWTNAFSMVIFGNQIRRGRVIGRTDGNGNIVGDSYHASVIGETVLELLGVGRFETRAGTSTNNRFPHVNLSGMI